MRELHSASVVAADSQKSFQIPYGTNMKYMLLRFTGTNDTGETIAISDLGDIVIQDGYRGTRIDLQSLYDAAVARRGVVQNASTTSGAFALEVPIPFHLHDDDKTIYAVGLNQNVRLTWNIGSDVATRIGGETLTWTVEALEMPGVQHYRLLHNLHEITIKNGQTTEPIPGENIRAIWMENNTNILRVVVDVDGKFPIDCQREALISDTHFRNNLETFSATTSKVLIDLNPRLTAAKMLNDKVKLTIHGGAAADITLYIVSVDFTDEEMKATMLADLADTRAAIERKSKLGRVRPLNVLEGLGMVK